MNYNTMWKINKYGRPPHQASSPPGRLTWHSQHQVWTLAKTSEILGIPPRAKYFIWLACLHPCWISDRLEHQGLPQPTRCPLRDQVDETLTHLLVDYVFAVQVWVDNLQSIGLAQVARVDQNHFSFPKWWFKVMLLVDSHRRKGCVFEHRNPGVSQLAQEIWKESTLWCSAGASGTLGWSLFGGLVRCGHLFDLSWHTCNPVWCFWFWMVCVFSGCYVSVGTLSRSVLFCNPLLI